MRKLDGWALIGTAAAICASILANGASYAYQHRRTPAQPARMFAPTFPQQYHPVIPPTVYPVATRMQTQAEREGAELRWQFENYGTYDYELYRRYMAHYDDPAVVGRLFRR